MAGSSRRVAVHAAFADGDWVDLALPAGLPVGALVPSLVDLVCADDDGTPYRWRLSRLGGDQLDESMTLSENAVNDGDILVLSASAVAAPVIRSAETAAIAAEAADVGELPAPTAAAAACLWLTALGAVVLLWAGSWSTALLCTAALLTVAMGVGAVLAARRHRDPRYRLTLNVITVAMAAMVAFAVVPGEPGTANGLLAAAAAITASILLLRFSSHDAAALTTVAAFSAPLMLAAGAGVAWNLPTATLGALQAALALALLGAAAKLSMAVGGLSPSASSPHPPPHRAHRLLTGMVVGLSGAAAVGTILVVVGHHDDRDWPAGVAFCAVAAVVLGLRARSHVDVRRSIALLVSAMVALSSAVALSVFGAPDHAHWVGIGAVVAGFGALAAAHRIDSEPAVNPVLRRGVDVVEYAALAALVPTACWVGDVYHLARSLTLA